MRSVDLLLYECGRAADRRLRRRLADIEARLWAKLAEGDDTLRAQLEVVVEINDEDGR